MRTDFDRAYVEGHGNIAVLKLNHPEVLNAASLRLVTGAARALDFISKPDSGFRCVVLTGEGRGFCSGANLAERGAGETEPPAFHALETVYHPFLRKMRDLRMPIITAVNGAAAGVGMSIALMGDLVLAGKSSYFLQAFARIGLVPDGGSTWILPRLIGLARAKELSLLAEKLPAEQALEWGLINRVVDDAALLDEALAYAKRIADGPTLSLSEIRRLYWASPHNTYEQQLDLEKQIQDKQGRTADFAEGVRAFLEKRTANFTGK
ncbi:MAG TPA: enoyl-CoA hydratase/isomerase [Rhizomicrobium sp.]|jgi:2-(1,2-epoxy-1,2-dihydrophenyl)acetyl-CoA isomerase|nr:enoyl-CoA hydratase/isomerase [Rhizomicrobium sp.]